MTGVSRLAQRLSEKLFENIGERQEFLEAMYGGQSGAPALILMDEKPLSASIEFLPTPAWCPSYVRRFAPTSRPGSQPDHETGRYYILDTSSVFASCALNVFKGHPERILDVCASPGGKSMLAWRKFHPEVLLCNEVIGKRLPALISNLKRCSVSPASVHSIDPQVLGQELLGSTDIVFVDAPCSGQSLIGKGQDAEGCFHPSMINMNANRQRRILASVAPCVRTGGVLAYMTCTFSKDENEGVVEWFLKRFPMFEAVPISELVGYQSKLTPLPCYRLFPHFGEGAGAFCTALRCIEERESSFAELQTVWSSQ